MEFSKDEGELNHFLDHMADSVQDPAHIKGTSHLFYSQQGTGKGLLAAFMCKLIGNSNVAMIITRMPTLTRIWTQIEWINYSKFSKKYLRKEVPSRTTTDWKENKPQKRSESKTKELTPILHFIVRDSGTLPTMRTVSILRMMIADIHCTGSTTERQTTLSTSNQFGRKLKIRYL